MATRAYFNAYHSYLETMELLNDAERGRLFTACLTYSMTGEVQELRGNEKFVFPGMKSQIDRDAEAYEAKCEKNRQNGAKGGSERKRTVANGSERKRTVANGGQGEGEGELNIPPQSPQGGWGEVAPELVEPLKEFERMRNRIRKPLTQKAKELALTKLQKLATDIPTQIAILEQSIINSWQGLFPLKEQLTEQPSPPEYQKLTRRRNAD